jgi:NADH:ubiquinone oxidoreductase subunit 2 (subunit N)
VKFYGSNQKYKKMSQNSTNYLRNILKTFMNLLPISNGRKKLYTLILFLLPATFTFAQSVKPSREPQNARDMACIFINLLLDFVPYIVVIAVGAFIMGLIRYVAHGDNEEKRSEGTKMMIYGILGLFFMVSVWGILNIFVSSFGLPFGVPQFKSTGQDVTNVCAGLR